MNERQRILLVATLVFLTVLASAITLVYTKHQSRKLFVELQQFKVQMAELNTEWGQLQLEQSAWSDHTRIEKVARTRLSMIMPDSGEVIFVTP